MRYLFDDWTANESLEHIAGLDDHGRPPDWRALARLLLAQLRPDEVQPENLAGKPSRPDPRGG